ncbi:MAG: DUF3488 domain-containing protein [Bacteriovoracaceae bacterium]|nr:DUF3488 domain-containing protein [Bacteriovoracaceae bacterium]
MAPFLSQHNNITIAFSGFGVLLCYFLDKRDIQLPRLLRYFFIIVSTVLVFRSFGSLKGLEAGKGLLSILAVIKLFEMKKPRDFFMFVLIVELLLVGHLLSSESLAVLAYVAGLSLVLFYYLAVFNTNHEFSLDKERIKITLKVFLASIPLALVLFFSFPRLYLGNFFISNIDDKGMMGFSEKLNPGDLSEIVTSNKNVFRAKISKNDFSQFDMYWRGAALTRTDGFNWVPGYTKNKYFYRFSEKVKFSYEVDFDTIEKSPLFLLEGSNRVNRKSRGKVERLVGYTFKMTPYNNQKIRFSSTVVETSFVPLGKKEKKVYQQLPKNISNNVKSLATRLGEGKKFDEKILAVKQLFFSKKFEYTLAPGKYNSKSPLDEFLFERRKGFCEHYASAAAILFRLMGLDARVVVGFQGGEFNPVGKYYLIQGKDAHAWVEVFNPNSGWVRTDPTSWIAPNRIRYGANAFFLGLKKPENISESEFMARLNNSFLKKLKFTLDMYYYELNRNFLGYDYDAQKDFFKKLGVEYKRPIYLLLICLLVCTIVVGLAIFIQNRKKASLPKWEVTYRKFLALLTKKSIDIESYMGPSTIKEKTSLQFFGQENVNKVFEMYILLKYGKEPKENLVEEFDEAVHEATKLVKQLV